MLRKVLCFLIFVVSICFSKEMTIFKNGQLNCVIVLPDNSTKGEEYAGKVLSEYILKTTDKEISIIKECFSTDLIKINIGKTEYTKKNIKEELDEEGFIIDFPDDKNIIIYGGDDSGTLFGVYEFCERFLGVRWLFPGELGEHTPKHNKLVIPSEKIKEEPYFKSRRLSGRGFSTTTIWEKETGPNHIWTNRLRGIGRVEFHHNLLNLFPPEKYKDTKPEIFPIINGERYFPIKDEKDPTWYLHGWQPCFSNPETVNEAIKNISEYFSKYPSRKTYSLGVNDSGGFCECENCLKYVEGKKTKSGAPNYSELYYSWCNKIVEKFPDKYFGLLAYSNVIEPPEKIKLLPNIVPFITQERLKWADEEFKEYDKNFTKRWEKVASCLGWYDYIYGKPRTHYIIPRLWPHLMAEYYRFGYENNVRHLYAEAYPSDDWREGPKLYITLKLQWNPYLDVDQMLNEWCEIAVGKKAGKYLKEYFTFWENYWTKRIPKTEWFQKRLYGGVYLDFNSADYLLELNENDFEYCEGLMKKVVENAEGEKEKKRAEFFFSTFEGIKKEGVARIRIMKFAKASWEELSKKIVSEEILLSEGFDTPDKKWNRWQRNYSKAKFEYDSEFGNQNKGCLKIDASGSQRSPVCFLKVFSKGEKIKMEDETYYFRCWYYSDELDKNAKIEVKIQWKNKKNEVIEIIPEAYKKGGKINQKKWDKIEIFFKPPLEGEPVSFLVLLSVENTEKGNVWFDDVYFSKVKLEGE